jgi:hypothetical protein
MWDGSIRNSSHLLSNQQKLTDSCHPLFLFFLSLIKLKLNPERCLGWNLTDRPLYHKLELYAGFCLQVAVYRR